MAPLDGILVADFSRVLAGPLAAMLLGDLGADVIKVERPDGGDDTRAWGPPWRDGVSTYYLGLNRNKRSIALDLKDPEDLALARELAERAAEVLEQRAGEGERDAVRAVAQLEPVAEDHETVDSAHGLHERLAQLGAPQQVRPLGRAHVQVGDHQRPHAS